MMNVETPILTPHSPAKARAHSIPDNRPKAVVIGSGFGGLAAAIRLGARGYQVTLVDRLDQPGGRASVFRQDGFAFDAGPTVVTAPWLFSELWTLCGKNIEDDVKLVPVDPFYSIRFDDGEVFNYNGDPAQMRAEVARFSPDDVAGYERFLAMSESIFKVGYEQLADLPFNTVMSMARIVPDMMKLQSYRTVYGLVSTFVKHEKLRQVLSFHPLLVGGNPFATTSIYTLICHLERKWGVYYAMGGTGSLVKGLVGLIEGQGSTIRLNTEVDEIVVTGKKASGVRLKSGEVLPADVVVSNADAAWTYKNLLRNHPRSRWTDRRIEKARYSMSLFVWYFGTRRQYPDVKHHTILMGPRYKALLNDIFNRKVLADDFSLYLHRPTATDPAMAPEGCDAFYVLSPVPHLDSGVDWATQAEPYRKSISQYLSSTLLPDLEANLVTSRLMTPQLFQDNLLSYKGSAFSLEPVLTQSAWFRPHNQSEELKGLYLVGAGTHPGAGMPGVLTSAKVLDRLVPHGSAVTEAQATLARSH